MNLSNLEVNMLKALGVLILLVSLAGCAPVPHKGMNGYIEKFDYTAFNLPRAEDGVGTVIDFKNGSETVVARGVDCFLKATESQPTSRTVAAADLETKVDWAAGGSFNLPETVVKHVDLAGVAKISGAKNVKVTLKKPFEQYISRLQFVKYMNDLKDADPCKAVFKDSDNLIIYQVLGAEGVIYQFLDSSDNNISLTAKLLEQADLKPELRRKSENTSKLEHDGNLLVGYRAWVVTKPSGTIGSDWGVEEYRSVDVEARRANSKN